MKFGLRFLAFALGTGLALATPTAAQAQVGVGVNIGLPPWGPPVPQGTQYYYIPEIDGYYDLYNGVYLVFDGAQWVAQPYLNGYDPYYFHPVPVSYQGSQPWLYIGNYRSRYPQYVTGYRRGGYGSSGRYYGNEFGAGRVYGYDRGGYGNGNRSGYDSYGNRGGYNGSGNRAGYGGPGNFGGSPRVVPSQGGDRGERANFGANQPARGGFGGANPGGQPTPGRGGNFGGGQMRGEGQRGGGDHGGGGQRGGDHDGEGRGRR